MSQTKRIFNNMSWLAISQIIASICAFIWTTLMARYLGVDTYGVLAFAISLTGILAILTDFGTGTYLIRHVATDYDSAPKYLGNMLPFKSIFCFFTFIVTIICLILMKADTLTITITLLFTIESILKSLINILNGVFQSFEEGKYQGIGNTLLSIILLVFILISIYTDLGIYGITFSYLFANLIVVGYEYYVLNKHITKPKFEIDLSFCKNITLLSLPFALTGLLYALYYSIDVVMLTNLSGNYASGIYNASYKLISVLTLFYSIYGAVIFPIMSKLFKNDTRLLIVLYEKSIKYLMLIIIPLSLATSIYSLDIVQFIYGQEYASASSVLSILIWTVCLLFLSGAGNNLLNASHKEISVTKIYTLAAVFNIILNLIIIPYLSFNGAAITTVLSDMLIVVLQTYIIYKLNFRPSKKLYYDLMKIIVGSAILGVALYFLNLNMWIALPVGIIIYFITIYLLKVFDDDDKYIVKEILGKN